LVIPVKPVVAVVGRPNVGKSTLFNRLTRTRDAIVADQPGLTRDRIYGTGTLDQRPYMLVDTGGLIDEKGGLGELVTQQSLRAAQEADAIIFLVDGRQGLTPNDEVIADKLRSMAKPIQVAVNKTEGVDPEIAPAEFFALGFGDPIPISSAHGQGMHTLMETVLDSLPHPPAQQDDEEDNKGIRIAVLGRPNVGKSTLVNRMLGEQRVLVFDEPGTTRDSVAIPFERDGIAYTLIDTAGVRRRARISECVEKFSVIKTLQALDNAHVVILVMDAREPVTDQDTGLIGMVLESGRALLLAMNKWDGLTPEQKEQARNALDRKLTFLDYASVHFISALHGTGVGHLFSSAQRAYASAFTEVSASRLTGILEAAVRAFPPPLGRGGRRIKLRYAHQGGRNPPQVIIHGNQVDALPNAYRRYLEKTFREVLGLHGTPIRIELRQGDNPFKGVRNSLTPRQAAKRKRLVRHLKREKQRR
jgi:GTP-binding protein